MAKEIKTINEGGNMKIWILKRIGAVGFDQMEQQLVRAENEEIARHIANGGSCDEGEIWDDPARVSCEEISIYGEAPYISSNSLGSVKPIPKSPL